MQIESLKRCYELLKITDSKFQGVFFETTTSGVNVLASDDGSCMAKYYVPCERLREFVVEGKNYIHRAKADFIKALYNSSKKDKEFELSDFTDYMESKPKDMEWTTLFDQLRDRDGDVTIDLNFELLNKVHMALCGKKRENIRIKIKSGLEAVFYIDSNGNEGLIMPIKGGE